MPTGMEEEKRSYSANNPDSVWKGITNYKTPSPNSAGYQQLTDDLNDFYLRDDLSLIPYSHIDDLSTQPSTPPANPLFPSGTSGL